MAEIRIPGEHHVEPEEDAAPILKPPPRRGRSHVEVTEPEVDTRKLKKPLLTKDGWLCPHPPAEGENRRYS